MNEIKMTPIEMGCLSLVALDENTGIEMANKILVDYDIHEAIQIGKSYAEQGNRVEIFYEREW